MTAENFPVSEFYKTDQVLTSLGIGEALVTALSEKGIPTPLAVTMMRAPQSRMDILSDEEIEEINRRSALVKKYEQTIEGDSSYEILGRKITQAEPAEAASQKTTSKPADFSPATKSVIKVLTSATFIRGAFGILSKMLKK